MQPTYKYSFLPPTSLTDMHNQAPTAIFKRFGNQCRDYFQFEQCQKYASNDKGPPKNNYSDEDNFYFIEALRRQVGAPKRRQWRFQK